MEESSGRSCKSTLTTILFASPTPTPSPRPATLKLSLVSSAPGRSERRKRSCDTEDTSCAELPKQRKTRAVTTKCLKPASLKKRLSHASCELLPTDGTISAKITSLDFSAFIRAEDEERIPLYAGLQIKERNWFGQYRPADKVLGEKLLNQKHRISQTMIRYDFGKTESCVSLDSTPDSHKADHPARRSYSWDSVDRKKSYNDRDFVREVTVQCSFFTGVLWNIGARYGIEVEDLIWDVLRRVSSGERSQKCPTEASHQPALKPEAPFNSWESTCSQVLGWQGRQFLVLDLEGQWMGQLAERLEARTELKEACHKILRVEIEAEAERRCKQVVVFRGLDGSRHVLGKTNVPAPEGGEW